MAQQEVSGLPAESDTEKDLTDLEAEFLETQRGRDGVPFEDAFCLCRIPFQPEDYSGPQRYCSRWTMRGRTDFCPQHKHMRHLKPTGNLKHGVKAMRHHLLADFNEVEQDAYQTIMDEWTEAYDLDPLSDAETLSSAAIEIIREIRADAILEDEGLRVFRTVYTDDGPARDDNGDVVKEDQEHYLLSERRAIRSEIEKLKQNLGITRAARLRASTEEKKADNLAAIGSKVHEAIEEGDREYDPEDPSYEDN